MPGFIIFVLFLLLVAGVIVISSLYVVKQQSVAIIEAFRTLSKISDSGIHMRRLLASIKLPHEFNCASCRVRSWLKQKTQDNVLSP